MAPPTLRNRAQRSQPTPNQSTRARKQRKNTHTPDHEDDSDELETSSMSPQDSSASLHRERKSSQKRRSNPQPTRRNEANKKMRANKQGNTRRSLRARGLQRPALKGSHDRAMDLRPVPKVPHWPPNLPYQVMLQIFQHAAHPLVDERFYGTQSVNWLLRTSRVCKNFTEPALAALYYCPPLLPPSRAHGLLKHLETQDDETPIMNYRTKIKYLDLEAVNVLSLKHAGQDSIDLKRLIEYCPMVRGIAIHLPADHPRFIEPNKRVAPIYSESLFVALDKFVSLHQFKWNYQIMTNSNTPWKQLSEIHRRPSFKNIQELEIAHFGDPIKLSKSRWNHLAQELGNSLGELSMLKSLICTKCRFDDLKVLIESSSGLRVLRFVDCDELWSDQLVSLLQAQGKNIQELVLKHNRALNLEFTASLAANCPSLEIFIMDFRYFNTSVFGGSSEPSFDSVLPDIEPTWPQSLQQIELHYIRKWNIQTATRFFNSLWISASELSHLRKLIIRSSIDGSWKDRIDFRTLWTERVEKAFRRVGSLPHRHQSGTVTSVEFEGTSFRNTSMLTAKVEAAQPLCETVDIRIDNLRPMSTMYNEEDFMDSEPSGDEDWDGENERDEGGYAW